MVLLALTAPIRAVQKSSCHELHSHSHQLLFLRDVMAMYRVTQNEVLPRNLLFPVQPCNVLQKMVLVLYSQLSFQKRRQSHFSTNSTQLCNVNCKTAFPGMFLCRFLKMPHKRMLKQEGLDHICLYYGAECAKTRERKWDRLKLFQCQLDGLLQTSFNLCSQGDSHIRKFILRDTQHSGSVTGSRVVVEKYLKGHCQGQRDQIDLLFLPSIFLSSLLDSLHFPLSHPHSPQKKTDVLHALSMTKTQTAPSQHIGATLQQQTSVNV